MSFAQVTSIWDAASELTVGPSGLLRKAGHGDAVRAAVTGRALNVTAPCSVARQFAAVALSRLAA